MKKKLVFKKSDSSGTKLRVVEVDIPDNLIDASWSLVSSCDHLEVVNSTDDTTQLSEDTTSEVLDGESFESNISGSSRLIRTREKIFIVFRKGTDSRNKTQPDSVCVDDYTKRTFFDYVTKLSTFDGSKYVISVAESPEAYKTWSKFIDEEYSRQRNNYNKLRKENSL